MKARYAKSTHTSYSLLNGPNGSWISTCSNVRLIYQSILGILETKNKWEQGWRVVEGAAWHGELASDLDFLIRSSTNNPEECIFSKPQRTIEKRGECLEHSRPSKDGPSSPAMTQKPQTCYLVIQNYESGNVNRESKFKKYFNYDSRKLKKGTKAEKKLDKILLQKFKQIRGIWLSSSVDKQ